MFKRRTLFILGAGASYEACLPTGVSLAKIIREKMDVRFGEGNKRIGGGDYDLFGQIITTHLKDRDAFSKRPTVSRRVSVLRSLLMTF
jgi:hypothetical protein